MNKIIIIIPYFGKLPSYYNLFFHSIKYVSQIDFLFVTDLKLDQKCPDHVKIKSMSLHELKRLIKNKLEVEPAFSNPYKLCDFRPAFGVLFEEEIKDYEFWGHSDIDLIFGNAYFFLESINYKKFDIISCRQEWVTGSFALYKNLPSINTLYLKSTKAKTIFESNKFEGFDECGYLWRQLSGKDFGSYRNFTDVESISHIVSGNSWIKLWNEEKIIKESLDDDEILMYKSGKIISLKTGKEFLHYHYVTEKRKPKLFKFPDWDIVPDEFLISKAGFWPVSMPISAIKSATFKRIRNEKIRYFFCDLPKKILKKLFS